MIQKITQFTGKLVTGYIELVNALAELASVLTKAALVLIGLVVVPIFVIPALVIAHFLR